MLCYSCLSLVSSLKSPLSHSWRLVLELTPLLFAPLHSPCEYVCVCVVMGAWVRRRWCCLLFLRVPLAELSSLPGTGYTAQLQGNHSAGNLRFHLSPIHSGTYLEQLSGCACHEPQEERRKRLGLVGSREVGINRLHICVYSN